MPNQKRKPKAKKDKDDDNETVIKPIGRLLKNEEQTKYDGDDYDRPGWKPGETKKAKDCNKIYDFRMCHMRHTRYRTEDGESEVRQVATCGWCHCAWTYPNVSRITKHFSQAGETGYKDCPAKIPAQALKEYKAFAARQKKKLGSSPQRQDGAPGGAQDKETEPLGVLDADASAKHPEKPSDDDPTKRLDAAIAKFFIVDGTFHLLRMPHVVGRQILLTFSYKKKIGRSQRVATRESADAAFRQHFDIGQKHRRFLQSASAQRHSGCSFVFCVQESHRWHP